MVTHDVVANLLPHFLCLVLTASLRHPVPARLSTAWLGQAVPSQSSQLSRVEPVPCSRNVAYESCGAMCCEGNRGVTRVTPQCNPTSSSVVCTEQEVWKRGEEICASIVGWVEKSMIKEYQQE